MHSRLAVCAAALLVSVAVPAERAKALEGVVASIAPVHSLVTGVMAGVAEPDLIVTGTASPHDYALRPSDAESLQNAPVVFWVGSGLETFLAGPLENLSDDTVAVALSEVPGVELKPFLESGVFKVEAGHDDHGHDHGGHD
ncbi:MAG: zinc ABC transporter substrate-binding protein, partial [Pseudomonadota bacterium]